MTTEQLLDLVGIEERNELKRADSFLNFGDDFKAAVVMEKVSFWQAIRAALTERDELKARLAEYARRARDLKASDIQGPIAMVKFYGLALDIIRDLAAEHSKSAESPHTVPEKERE